jgi:hypothetical protein
LQALRALEAELSICAVYENGELEDFEDHAIEFLEDFRDALVADFVQCIQVLIQEGSDPYLLDLHLRAGSIEEFFLALLPFKEEFPLTYNYIETLDNGAIEFGPLPFALREHFSLDVIRSISNRLEFSLALKAYLQLSDWGWMFKSDISHDWLIPNLEELKALSLATTEEKERIEELISQTLDATTDVIDTQVLFAPEFSKSTGGYENLFLSWLNRLHSNEALFEYDDDFEGELLNRDADLDLLCEQWLNHESARSETDPLHPWQSVGVQVTAEFETSRGPVLLEIHQISQHGDNLKNFKVVLFRTGEPHEYNAKVDQALLACQSIFILQSDQFDVESVTSEIYWLRLNQREYPLSGLSTSEMQILAQSYIETQ